MSIPELAPVDLDTVLDDILAVRDNYRRGLISEGTCIGDLHRAHVPTDLPGCTAEPNAANSSENSVDMAHDHANVGLEIADG